MARVSLVIGSNGQIGQELAGALLTRDGSNALVTADIAPAKMSGTHAHEVLDACDINALREVVIKHGVTEVYHLAAILSANGEKNPMHAWHINMQSLLNVLEVSRELKVEKVFWPSSIAAFGQTSPKQHTPQETIMSPNTAYGISKLSGELWCQYYHAHHGLDVRSLRYPGLMSYLTPPGGGTTDYVIAMILAAVSGEDYRCFLGADTPLPMMYMEDAISATLQLMAADREKIKVRTAYNLAGDCITPRQLAQRLKTYYPHFKVNYAPDHRQAIADSWPYVLDDIAARQDWGWQAKYSLEDWLKAMIDGFLKAPQKKSA